MSLEQELRNNTYPGRGVVVGRSEDGSKAVAAYFIVGGSASSHNRVSTENGEGIRTQAFDPARLEDPNLIVYAPVRVLGSKTTVTNGDQTDTIYEGMNHRMTLEQSLRSKESGPDAPNYALRISGIIHIKNGDYNYAMSVLENNNDNPDSCLRFTCTYKIPTAEGGRFIHTCMHDGDPLPSLEKEPKAVEVSENIDQFMDMIWNSLDQDNKVSLFARFIGIASGAYETRIVDKGR